MVVRFLLSPLFVVLAACGSAAASIAPSTTSIAAPEVTLETIHLPVSLYVVIGDTGPSSARTPDEVAEIGARMTEIWSQAGIALDITVVGEIEVPSDVIAAVAARDGRAFLVAANQGRFEIPEPGALIGFYVPDAGGANGFAPLALRTFFVSDVSTVHDERVSSHEIGHILGLHHALDDQGRLMFSGTNGMTLAPDEIAVARYIAQGILDGVR
ncbi:MAG: hypothetical protein V3S62_08515 [Acidimicrobiia bacterium]